MSILAQNLKLIRKELRCTQLAMADILSVGFRTYVRYEAGERDAPVSILVKIAKLGNLSLDQLLTTEVTELDIVPRSTVAKNEVLPKVKHCDFQSGKITFQDPPAKGLLAIDNSEKKLLGIYRKLDSASQPQCLESASRILNASARKAKTLRGKKKPAPAAQKASANPPERHKKIAKLSGGSKGTRGRKKADRRFLKDKVNKLKMIAQSVNKITVK